MPVEEANPGSGGPRPGSGGSGINSGAETPDQIIRGNSGGAGGSGQPQGGDIFSNMETFGEPASPTNEGSPPGSPPRPNRFNPSAQPGMLKMRM